MYSFKSSSVQNVVDVNFINYAPIKSKLGSKEDPLKHQPLIQTWSLLAPKSQDWLIVMLQNGSTETNGSSLLVGLHLVLTQKQLGKCQEKIVFFTLKFLRMLKSKHTSLLGMCRSNNDE